MAHSGGPFKAEKENGLVSNVYNGSGEMIAKLYATTDGSGRRDKYPGGVIISAAEAHANAEFIAHACNNHYALLDVLRGASRRLKELGKSTIEIDGTISRAESVEKAPKKIRVKYHLDKITNRSRSKIFKDQASADEWLEQNKGDIWQISTEEISK